MLALVLTRLLSPEEEQEQTESQKQEEKLRPRRGGRYLDTGGNQKTEMQMQEEQERQET